MGSNDCTVCVSKELEIKEKRNGEVEERGRKRKEKKKLRISFPFVRFTINYLCSYIIREHKHIYILVSTDDTICFV